MSRTLVNEARTTAEATPVAGQPGRFLLTLITPGWGSSGYYSPEVLEAAAAANVFPAGLHSYLDHPHGDGSGVDESGNRSVKDLASVLNENARWTGEALVAEATVFGPYREVLKEMREAIGLSVRAYAETSIGEAEGRRGTIIDNLVEGISADYVTKAGRGGRIEMVLESARPTQVNRRAVQNGVAEATANDTREALQTALKDTYGAEDSWVWVRDFDDETVWYEHETPGDTGTYAEGYSLDDAGAVTLAGQRTEVRVRTEYVPVNPAGQPNTTTEESEEDTMPEIAESELVRLREADGRVQTLESELSTEREARESAEQERDQLRESNAQTGREDRAREIITARATEAGVEFTPREVKGFLADVTVTESGDLDEAALTTMVDKDAAALKEAQGAGRPRGLGYTAPPAPEGVSESDLDALDDAVFGQIKEA